MTAEKLEYLADMNELYRFAEGQFLEFNELVPISKNDYTVVSPKLYSILMTTCGQIESIIIRICKELKLKTEESFASCYAELSKHGILEEQSVEDRITRCIFKPFLEREKTPPWWQAHNKTKHDLPSGFMEANIRNTLNALGGLYLLHYFYKSIPYRNPNDILKSNRWSHNKTAAAAGIIPPITHHFDHIENRRYESELFIRKSHFYESD